MLNGAMLVWFTLTTASFAFVVWDSITNGVTSWVQRAAWILVTLYTGPIGLVFYLLACRRPFPGAHDAYTKAPWKQGLNSEMHCVAGDATGILIAAAVVPAFHLANGLDILIEYTAGFVCGLFIFQALMMRGMYGGDYFKAVRKTFFAETVSMNMVMTGMIPTMVLLAHAWPGSEDPINPEFWFRMSIATIVGAVIAFPINHWLVSHHLKHGCMTLPGADQVAPHLGHRSPEPAMAAHGSAHGDMAMGDMKHDSGHGEMPMGDMKHSSGHGGMAMEMPSLPRPRALAWIGGTYAVLLTAIVLTALFVPITF